MGVRSPVPQFRSGRMRILLTSLYFHPEPIGISRVTGEMARWLARRGHSVRVVCGVPFYPQWRAWPGFETPRLYRESWEGVEVCRVPHWVPRNPSGIARVGQLATYGALVTPALLAHRNWRPDVVFSVQPTLAAVPGSLVLSRLCGAVSWHHVQDFEVDAAFDLGLVEQSPGVGELVRSLERRVLSAHDMVSTISTAMLNLLSSRLEEGPRSCLFPNWVDTEAIKPVGGSSFRTELGIEREQRVILYSGNMGNKQGLEVLIAAARLLREEQSLVFVLAGEGSERQRLENSSADLVNVRWLPLQPAERLAEFLSMADVHVLPQRAEAEELVLPSKVNTILAVGGALVATARERSALAQLVARCGKVVPPGDAAAFAAAISAMATDDALRATLGLKARRLAETELSINPILEDFEEKLVALVVKKRGGQFE